MAIIQTENLDSDQYILSVKERFIYYSGRRKAGPDLTLLPGHLYLVFSEY
jgi:hypothetical protein